MENKLTIRQKRLIIDKFQEIHTRYCREQEVYLNKLIQTVEETDTKRRDDYYYITLAEESYLFSLIKRHEHFSSEISLMREAQSIIDNGIDEDDLEEA